MWVEMKSVPRAMPIWKSELQNSIIFPLQPAHCETFSHFYTCASNRAASRHMRLFKLWKLNIKKFSSPITLAIFQVLSSQLLVSIILDGTDREKSHQCRKFFWAVLFYIRTYLVIPWNMKVLRMFFVLAIEKCFLPL